MEYRTLGRSGLVVSSIGLGCVTFGREVDADDACGRGLISGPEEEGLDVGGALRAPARVGVGIGEVGLRGFAQ